MKHLYIPALFALICFSFYSQTGPGAILPDDDEISGWRPAGELNYKSALTSASSAKLNSSAPCTRKILQKKYF